MSEKEIVFVGRMQNKTRDYINNLEKENRELQQENQILKRNCNIGYEELNFYREEYKKYKSVLDEIREIINIDGYDSKNRDEFNKVCNKVLQILDKAGKEWKR